jgi:histidyl-tRNA synthetase
MAGSTFHALPGFRDFPPRECAVRNYLFDAWRSAARRFGFVEFEGPLLEDTGLYLRKSGGELSKQLFRFIDQGGREVTLRPELTASLARIVAGQHRHHQKPLKWFEIGPCFRYEKPQKGRGREFHQFNADILGESGPGADAELIALAVETMRVLGFRDDDFVVRVSDRQAWASFAAARGLSPEQLSELLSVVDKLGRDDPAESGRKLANLGLTMEALQGFLDAPGDASAAWQAIRSDLEARGMAGSVRLDLSIVRGLAYYTGVVFEVFDAGKSMRAVAGGGRYDGLISALSEGAADLPAAGFAMGDHVIRNLIEETPHAAIRMEAWLQRHLPSCDVYLVLADEALRGEALGLAGRLRAVGVSTDLPLSSAKVARQFQAAEKCGARYAVVIGSEHPRLKVKVLTTRSEAEIGADEAVEWIVAHLAEPDGPLLA